MSTNALAGNGLRQSSYNSQYLPNAREDDFQTWEPFETSNKVAVDNKAIDRVLNALKAGKTLTFVATWAGSLLTVRDASPIRGAKFPTVSADEPDSVSWRTGNSDSAARVALIGFLYSRVNLATVRVIRAKLTQGSLQLQIQRHPNDAPMLESLGQ